MEHIAIRNATVAELRAHPQSYREFMEVKETSSRRRRNTGKASTALPDMTEYTSEQLQKRFEEHLEKMALPGEWGGNMEVFGCATAMNVDIVIWHADPERTVTISPRISSEDERATLNIAYHVSNLPIFLVSSGLN